MSGCGEPRVREGFLEEETHSSWVWKDQMGVEMGENSGCAGRGEGKEVSRKSQEGAGWALGRCSVEWVNQGVWNLPPGIPLPKSRRGDCLVWQGQRSQPDPRTL